MIEIATCSFGEFRPEMGMPVRASVGAPRWFSHPHACWENVYPERHWLHLPYAQYLPRYLDKLDSHGPAKLRADLTEMASTFARRNGGEVPTTAVLLCYEKLSKVLPGNEPNWCHRTMLAEWIKFHLEVDVVELGALPGPVVDPDPTLF